MKKALRNIFNCIVASMILLGCAATCFAANVAATNVTIHGQTMTYSGTQTITSLASGKQATDGSTSCTFDNTNKFTITAKNSKYYNYWITSGNAQNYSMKLTLTNSSGTTIKITYTTSGITGVADGEYSDITMQNGESLYFTVSTNVKYNTNSQSTITGTVTIDSITTVAGAKVSFVSSSHGAYSAVVGNETVSMASGAETTEDYNVSIGDSITLTAGQAAKGYEFYCWMGGGKQLGTTTGSYTINEDMVVYPVYLPEGTEKPFTVDGTGYMFWHQAIAASKESGKPAILAQNYTLPTTLEANGLCAGHLYSDYVSGADGNLTYTIPYGSKLLIPYGSGDSGSFGATPQNYISEEDGCLMFDDNGMATRNFAYRTLTVPSGTKIACHGGLNPNGQRQKNGQPYTGVTLGGYGKIHLAGSGTQLTVHSGGALYCYGYIVGSGKVEVLSSGSVHELLQICDWPGGSNAANPLGSWKNEADVNTLFLLSQYYIQNIEAPLKVNYGATAFIEAVITGYQETIPNSSVYIGTGGLFILESGAYLERIYDAANDRMDYHIYGKAALSSITVKTDFVVTVTLTSSKYILPLNGNIRVYVEDEAEMTLAQKIALLPGAEVIIKKGGTVNSSSYIYIVDVADWSKSYFFNRTSMRPTDGSTSSYVYTLNTAPKFAPVPYVATLDGMSPRTTQLKRGSTVDDKTEEVAQRYYMSAISCTASGKLVVNGTLNISGTICTTNKSSSANKAITGTGMINYTGTPAAGTLKAGYSKTISTISTTYGLGNLAGVGTLQPFAAGDYYGTGDYWYQHVINTEGGTVTVTSTNGAEGSTLSPLDTRKDGISDVVARVANGGSITYTIPAGYGVSINGTFQTPDDKGVYTLSNITADTTLVLHKHTSGTAVRENETRATCTTAGSYDSVVYCTGCGEELSRTQETEPAAGHSGEYALVDGMYIRTCTVCDETETEYPVQLMGMSLWTDGEVGLWLKVEISDILLEQDEAYIVVTEEENTIEDEQVTRFTMEQLKAVGTDSNGRYILKQSIASGEMTGDVTITAYDADGNQLCIGDYKEGADFLDDTNPKAVTRTVLDYVRLVLAADPETYADLRAMVTAMVTYGGYAQEYFGVDTENPAYGVLGEFGIDMPDLSRVSIDQELTITPSGAAAAVLSELGDTAETEPSVSETEAEETVESSTEPTVTETTPEETVESETVPEETAAADETVPADTASGETQAETVVTESTESTEADTSAYTADVSISVMSVASTASTESTAETSGFGLEYASQTVTLDSKISLKTYFTLAEGTSIEDYTFTYTRQGSETTEELTAVQSGSRYYVLIENIPVAYWDSMYDLTVTGPEGDTYTVSSSVLAWVNRCLTGTDQGTALNSLARAMFWYNQCANAYFGK